MARPSTSGPTSTAAAAAPEPRAGGDAPAPPPVDSPLGRARALVLAHGWNATAYQIVNPGIALWFPAAGDAVIGFVRHAGYRVVAGAPVCARERLAAVVREFEDDAAAAGEHVCYFGAEGRLEHVVHGDRRHAMIRLGAQPAWDPHGWPAVVAARSSLRAQLNRARNKGVRVREWTPRAATGAPALRACLAQWLATRGLPPLHFLVEPDTLERLWDRRIFVAERGSEVVGFLVASPVPGRHGWLTEQFPRGRSAPNGTAELLIDACARAVAADGATYFTLGLSPLSARAGEPGAENAAWLRLGLRLLRAHGRRFYNFGGLDTFKAKFAPDRWEPVFAVSTEPRVTVRTLYAIASAFTAGHPVETVARGVASAALTELRWLGRRLRHRSPGSTTPLARGA